MLAQRAALLSLLLLALGASGELQIMKSLRAKFTKADQDPFEADMEANPTAARAEVYAEPSEQDPTLELVRFTTGYNKGLDSFVDVTAYTPLFMKPLGLKMYGTIDAHGKEEIGTTRKTVYYQPNPLAPRFMHGPSSQQPQKDQLLHSCPAREMVEGNGWKLSADLIFFKHTAADPNAPRAAPREILSLASGYHSTHAIGAVTMHTGKITENGNVMTDSPVDLTGVTNLVAYNCEDGEAVIKKAALGDYIAGKAERWYIEHHDSKHLRELEKLTAEVKKFLLDRPGNMVDVEPIHADAGDHGAPVFGGQNVEAFFDANVVTPVKGLPVFFAGNVFTEQMVDDGEGHMNPWNMTFPFREVGEVVWVQGNKMGLKIKESCHPSEHNNYGVKLMVPRSKATYDDVNDFIQSAVDLGKLRASVDFGASATTPQQRFHLPQSDRFGTLKRPEAHGMQNGTGILKGAVPIPADGKPIVLKEFKFDGPTNYKLEEDAPACVVAERKSGRVIERTFDTPLMEFGDVALLHVTVTGNGWEYTQEHCGEYCDIKYRLRINDHPPIELNQWRNDCGKNPNHLQKGEWWTSRNGGCPGAVEPGAITDITRYLHETNTMALDILVYDPKLGHYLPYTNVKGWLFGEEASLMVSASVHVYAQGIKEYYSQKTADEVCSTFEHVLMAGTGYSSGFKTGHEESHTPIPKSEEDKQHQYPTSLLEQFIPKDKMDENALEYVDEVMENPEAAKKGPAWAMKLMQDTQETGYYDSDNTKCFNFEATAPFFNMHHGKNTLSIREKIDTGNAITVPVLRDVLIQGDQRYFSVPLNLLEIPFHWRQVGLHLKLESPNGHHYEHWPRAGSVGLEISRDSDNIHTHDVFDPSLHPGVEAGASRVGIIGALLATLFTIVA